MAKQTINELLRQIEHNENGHKLDLRGFDFSEIDLSRQTIERLLKKSDINNSKKALKWFSNKTHGINLAGADLRGTNLHEANLWFADLQGADLEGANLERAILSGANFEGANLRNAFLRKAKFEGSNLSKALLGGAGLRETSLEGAVADNARLGTANLQLANFTRASLREAELWFADLRGINLSNANLQDSNLQGANLESANLTRTNFRNANLTGSNLTGASLKHAELNGANLQDVILNSADLSYCHLEEVDISCAKSVNGAFFYGSFLNDTRIRASLIGGAIGEEISGNIERAREAYLILKNNFTNIGRYDDQSWAYIKECRMERAMSKPTNVKKYFSNDLEGCKSWRSSKWWKVYFYHIRKWFLDGIVELICMYGESFWRVLVTLMVVFVGFTTLYGLSGSVLKEQIVDNQVYLLPTKNLVDLIIFSLGALTTMEPNGLQPANNSVQLIAGIEAFLGIALTGLLGFVLGNKIRRL